MNGNGATIQTRARQELRRRRRRRVDRSIGCAVALAYTAGVFAFGLAVGQCLAA